MRPDRPACMADISKENISEETSSLFNESAGAVSSRDQNPCSSAKQHCKMPVSVDQQDPEISLTYTWEQTDSDVAVTVCFTGLTDDLAKAFDISFTNNTVHIGLSEDKAYDINFFGAIQKEKSRVQLKKGYIILLIVKQLQGLWPDLESKDGKPSHMGSGDELGHADGRKVAEKTLAALPNGDAVGGTQDSPKGEMDKSECDEEKEPEAKDKPEEPVYHLDLLKHDFFERDLNLTVQVYIKCLHKDAVKIVFNKPGFILKFHTGDAKFLSLHSGTSSETTFSWPVTTRQEIVPDKCKFRVKPSGIEISLHKTSNARWASLEAPIRKEGSVTASTSWLPISGQGPTVAASNLGNSIVAGDCDGVGGQATASGGVSTASASSSSSSSVVAFDEMLDVDLKKGKGLFTHTFGASSDKASADTDYLGGVIQSKPDWNKPTAKVHPLNNQLESPTVVISAGFAGLVNLGNTCFMNCVLQVLSNTREFRDYFLDDRFQHEINEDNPLGMRGQLAVTFGLLIKRLWSRTKHCWEPRKLKDLISKKNPQFFGYAQHDAHEFLAFLLDGLHEDLNRIRKKPYTETIDSNGRPDEVVAGEAWAQYKQRNDSVVVDLFQGQYKSKLVCPKCGKVSITFDPFLYLSVPLPKKKKVISVTFMWKESYKKPVQYQIVVSQDSTVEKLKEELSKRTNVKTCDIRVFEAHRGRIHKFFLNGASLANVDTKDIIIASEVLSEELAGEEVLEIPVMQRTFVPTEFPNRCSFCHKSCLELESSPLKRCTKCFKVGYCDQTCQRNHWHLHKSQCSTSLQPVGCPFLLSLPASRATYSCLVKHMEGCARFSVDIFQPPVKTSESSGSITPITTISTSCPAASSSTTTLAPSSSAPAATTSLSSTPGSLSSGLSQSCSSLNSLDSLSSASSTCTLTGDQSDTQVPEETGGDIAATAVGGSARPPGLGLGGRDGATGDSSSERPPSVDSGVDTGSVKSGVLKSQVMGVQVSEVERDRAFPTFYIKPVTMEGVAIKGADRLEDKGDTPLELVTRRILSMDWRNNDRAPSYVLVRSKELEGEVMDNLNTLGAASGSKPTLYQCLDLFTEPEVLSPEEAWYCPSCKKHVEASKQMSIWRLPHTLIIQLKRFSFHNFLMRSKIKKLVHFPTRGLDLSQFCVGLKDGDQPPVYDLYGVANHHGLLIGGHYTSYAKCFGEAGPSAPEVDWRLCDDSRVSTIVSEKSVVTADAYLLFYRRRGCPATINIDQAMLVSSPSPFIQTGNPQPNITNPTKTASVTSSCDDVFMRPSQEDPNGKESSHPEADDLEEEEDKAAVVSTSVQMKEIVNNRLLSELSRGEGSMRAVDHKNLNQDKVISAPMPANSFDNKHLVREDIYKFGSLQTSSEEQDLMEKQDKEKDVDDGGEKTEKACGVNRSMFTPEYQEIEDDQDEDCEARLIIDTSPNLGYTDMEAVD